MVYLFGGTLITGSAPDGAVSAAYGDVVVVTIFYRLGAFGFLYGATEDAPGNQGLYDQALALTWDRENVDRFNGNPDSMTLFGESSGASSVVFHLLSPMTQSMVHRAIVQSGGVHRRDLVGKGSDMLDREYKLAKFLGCSGGADSPGELSADTVNCIRATNATELSVTKRLLIDGKNTFFDPIFDDAFMPVEPRLATFPGDKGVLIGQVESGGTSFISQYFRETFSAAQSTRKINKVQMTYFFGKTFPSLNLTSLKKVQDEYMGHLQDLDYDALKQALVDAPGGGRIVCSTVGTALMSANATSLNSAGAGVYFYRISQVPQCIEREAWLKTAHTDDIPYVFGTSFEEGGCARDSEIRRTVMRIWSSFAKKT